MFKAPILICFGFLSAGEEDINELRQAEPSLYRAEWGMLMRDDFRNAILARL